jgi:hypothetical protein
MYRGMLLIARFNAIAKARKREFIYGGGALDALAIVTSGELSSFDDLKKIERSWLSIG